MVLESLTILLATLASRVIVAKQQEPAFDVHGHLYFAQTLAEQRAGPFGSITMKVVGASGFTQPFMWHWLIGRFDSQFIRMRQAWLNALVDAVFVCAAFVLTRLAGFGNEEALLAVAVYLLTPMWFSSLAIGPRIAGFTPRLSAEVATNLFFLLTLLPVDLPSPWVFAAAVLLAAFVLSSSKFGVQAMLLMAPLAGALAGRPLPVAALAAAVILLVIASRGRALAQLQAQLAHLGWYFRENLRGRMHVSDRNSVRALLRTTGASRADRFARTLYRAVGENSYTAVALKMPILGLLTYAAIAAGIGVYTGGLRPLAAPVAAGVVLFLLINLRPLLFLGEAERYLNHVAWFIALLAARVAMEHSLQWALAAILAYGLGFWLLESFALPRLTPLRMRQRAREDAAIIGDLRQRMPPDVVLCYPYHAGGGAWRVMAETPHQVVYCFGLNADFARRFNEQYAAAYPCVRLDRLDEMADEYQIGYLVVDRRELATRGLADWAPSERWTRLPLGGEIYEVFTRTRAAVP